MLINFIHHSSEQTTIHIVAEEFDAEPSLKSIDIKARHLHRVQDVRWSLIGYLLARSLTSARMCFGGVSVPKYIASSFRDDFKASEFFIEPVTSISAQILPKVGSLSQMWDWSDVADVGSHRPGGVSVRRTAVGYLATEKGEDLVVDWPILTNLPLFLTLSERTPHVTERIIIACLLYDIVGAHRVDFASGSNVNLGLPTDLMANAGFSFERSIR